MKYKVGDKVTLTNGDIMTVDQINDKFKWYFMREDPLNCYTDEMIECKVEEETNDCEKCGLTRNSTRCLFMDNCPHNKHKNIIEIPEDYVLKDENGNVINATKIVLEKKKKEYPKTYGYCCDTLECCSYNVGFDRCETSYDDTLHNKLLALRKLIICRDAYWKIAGEEMGLGKPWEPDWGKGACYTICCNTNQIVIGTDKFRNSILAFPTEEMRDTFKENFDKDLEICKELL